jgi:8-oxo-dGTP diphosphatase
MQRVHVAVGVILDADHNILLTRRPEHVHQGGLWEFPGGKVEADESLSAALERELQEELNITPLKTSSLIEIHHDYGDKAVLLDVHVVWEFTGEPSALEGQPMVWATPEELVDYQLPAANLEIVKAISALLI